MVLKKSQAHLDESDMTYFYHLKHGIVNGTKLIAGGLTSYVHALCPFIFKKHSLLTVIYLYNEVKKRKHVKQIIKDIDERQLFN